MRRLGVLLVGVSLAMAALAACGGDDETTEPADDDTVEVDDGAPADEEAATAEITAAYECFLDDALGLTLEETAECIHRMSDDDDLFDLLVQTNEARPPEAADVSVEVASIEFLDATSAEVAFNLVLGGEVVEGIAPPGGAVLVDGEWLVSTLTFCNLTALATPEVATEGPCADIILEDEV